MLRCSSVSNTVVVVDALFKENSNNFFKKNKRLIRKKLKPRIMSLIFRKKSLAKLPKTFFKRCNIRKRLCFFRRTNVRYNHQTVLNYFSNRQSVYQQKGLKRFSVILRRATFNTLAAFNKLSSVRMGKSTKHYEDCVIKVDDVLEAGIKRIIRMRKKHR